MPKTPEQHPRLYDMAMPSAADMQQVMERGNLQLVQSRAALIQVVSDIPVNDTRLVVQQVKYAVPALAVVCKSASGAQQTFYVIEDAAQEALKNTKGAALFRAVSVVQSGDAIAAPTAGKQGVAGAMATLKGMLQKSKSVLTMDEKVVGGVQKMIGHELYLPANYMQMMQSPIFKRGMLAISGAATCFKVLSYRSALEQMVHEGKLEKGCEITGSVVGGSLAASAASTALVWGSRVFGKPLTWGGKAACVLIPYAAGFGGAVGGNEAGACVGSAMDQRHVGQRVAVALTEAADVKKTLNAAIGRTMAMHELQDRQDARYHAMVVGNQVVVLDGVNPFSATDINAWMGAHAGSKDAKDVAAQVALIRANYNRLDAAVFGALEPCERCDIERKTPVMAPMPRPNTQPAHRL